MHKERKNQLKKEMEAIEKILADAPEIDRNLSISKLEFQARQKKVYETIAAAGCDVGIVFSDEHYKGDVPYLGGNTNISIEQVAGAIGKTGFHIIAGLEGGYVSEQLARRAGAFVHKVELLKLADEDYPIKAEKLEEVLEAAAGGKVKRIGLLTVRQVMPAALADYLGRIYGSKIWWTCRRDIKKSAMKKAIRK